MGRVCCHGHRRACRLVSSADIGCAQPSQRTVSMPRLRKVTTAKRVGAPTGRTRVIAKRTVGLKSTAKRVGAKSSSKRVGPKSNYKRVGRKRVVAKADGLTKFQRFRRRQAHKGMKLLRIWVPGSEGPWVFQLRPLGKLSFCVAGRKSRKPWTSSRLRSNGLRREGGAISLSSPRPGITASRGRRWLFSRIGSWAPTVSWWRC